MSGWNSFKPRHRRHVLLVFPRYAKSFGTFDHAFALLGVRAFMPPQGILLIASLLPREWSVKFVDENVRPVRAEELEWADVVFLSGMHVQRGRINELNQRAHRAGKLTVVGGPSVSAAPEFYPEADVLHCGEVGDATWRLFEHLDQSVDRPPKQLEFRTGERLPLSEFPSPAYELLQAGHYLMGSIQFSSGCPFTCEFCDIPGLYGRKPRAKTPAQVIGELDRLRVWMTISLPIQTRRWSFCRTWSNGKSGTATLCVWLAKPASTFRFTRTFSNSCGRPISLRFFAAPKRRNQRPCGR
jgi:hypothetical protein